MSPCSGKRPRSSALDTHLTPGGSLSRRGARACCEPKPPRPVSNHRHGLRGRWRRAARRLASRSPLLESPELSPGQIGRHTSELQSQSNLVCRLLLEKKKKKKT